MGATRLRDLKAFVYEQEEGQATIIETNQENMSLEDKADNFIQSRLDALYAIDSNIVSLLDNLSLVFETYHTSPTSVKTQFPEQVETIYETLSKIAIDLRKEVKIMDDNIGVYDKNADGVMILPISVDQKNTQLGYKRLNEEVKELDKLLEKGMPPHEHPLDDNIELQQKEEERAVPHEDIEMGIPEELQTQELPVQQPEIGTVDDENVIDKLNTPEDESNVIDKLKSRDEDDDNDDDLFEEV